MFGYVRPHKAMLLVCEYEEYKAVYCTLCRNLGKYYNVFTRMALNYDLTFYTMLALDLERTCPKLRRGKCVVNPLKKCNYMCEESKAYHKGAALTVLMTYHKILDNIQDDSFFKSLSSRLLMPFIKSSAKKASKEFPNMADALKEMMIAQNEIEQNKNASIDACCEPTAQCLSKIFAELSSDNELILSQLGYFLGRWIYMIDAVDDLKKDLKDNSFNSLKKYFKIDGDEISPELQTQIDEEANEILNNNVGMIVPAFNLLDTHRYGSIMENILTKGLPQIQKEILFLHIRDKERKKLHDRSV